MSKKVFLEPSSLEYQLPNFEEISDESYRAGFYHGCEEQLREIAKIISSQEITFENTIVALERSGQILSRTLLVFFNKSSSDTNDLIDEIDAEISPKLSAHRDGIYLNPALFARVEQLYLARGELGLDSESLWLVEKYYEDFREAGAHLDEESRTALTQINTRLSELETKFGQLLLADTNDLSILIDNPEELEGLSSSQLASAALAAHARGHQGKWLISAVNYSGHPLLSDLRDRELRKKIMEASIVKAGRGNENDTQGLVSEITALRAKRAKILGAKSHSEYVISYQTAKHPDRVDEMLRKIAPIAMENAKAEARALQAQIVREGLSFDLESWDWSFYTEKVRQERYNLDVGALTGYFELERTLFDGVFYAATRLYGITFKERSDLKTYHPEARAFEVFNEDGSKLALFIGDFFTRDSKRGGAWMNNLVDQSYLLDQLPVVVNNLNIPKPADGQPSLLTLDEVKTLFHEFGHALHGIFSAVRYPKFSGTSVQRDFVEFPSQVNEMWMFWPEVIENYARHYQSGEPLPVEVIKSLKESETFNEGYETTSYLAATVLDLALHSIEDGQLIEDLWSFEAKVLGEYGLLFAPIPSRYRSTYFSHIFAGGYSAGYYGYIWSEVLDADTVAWFMENGGLARRNGDYFREALLSRGGSLDSMEMFRNFRGRDSDIAPLLKRRGLVKEVEKLIEG